MRIIVCSMFIVFCTCATGAQGQQASISVPGIGQTIITAHTSTPKPTSPPFLTFRTPAGKLLKRIDFGLEGIDAYSTLLKFKVFYPSKKPSPLIVAVASLPGGSAVNFETAIIAFVDGQISEVIVDHIESHSLDALCYGTFGKDQNVGFVYFHFLWEDEIHYDPHRYEASYYEWTGNKFTKIGSKQTKNKYREWKGAAAELGYRCQHDFLSVLNSYGCNFSNAQQRHEPDPHEGRWRYQLSEKTLFENQIDSHECEKLTVENQFIGWVSGLSEVGTSLIFRICTKEEPSYKGAATEGAIYGGVDSGWYELRKAERLQPKKLILPKMNDFSSPSYCGALIAYWGPGKGHSYYGMVYDLGKRMLLKEKLVGCAALETDNMYVLNPPLWSRDCSSVTFADENFEQKVTSSF